MKWQNAVTQSPSASAYRWVVPNQEMSVDQDGYVCQQRKPNFALYDSVNINPSIYNDWIPSGVNLKSREVPIDSGKFMNGYVAPDGTFYGCNHRGHIGLEEALVFWHKVTTEGYDNRDRLLKAGYICIWENGDSREPQKPMCAGENRDITDDQKNALVLWRRKYEIPPSLWLDDD